MKEYISREALKQALTDKFKSRIGASRIPTWNDAFNAVTNLPPAADVVERPRWIPVTERLPELREEVLVCNEDYGETELGFAEVAVWDGSDWICKWDMESRLHYITHWQPLPEPPKENV